MPTDIKLKNSVTASNAPTSLQQGEVAINITDKKVWVGNAATTPVLLLGSGADGTFTNLTVSGVASFADGTASLPSITNIGDTNTGIFFPAADTIAFTEGGAERMRIDSNGDVSVASANAGSRSLSVYNSDAGAGSYSQFYIQTNNGYFIQSLGSTANGGVASFYATGTGGMYHYTSGATPFYFGTNSTERMRIDSSGNVGIGTSSPQANLQVGASSDVTIAMSNSSSVTSGNRGTISMFNSGASTVGYIRFGAVTDNVGTDIQFGIRPVGGSVTEAMRITSGGILQVNTTASAPSTGSDAKLMVKGNDGVIDCYSNSNGAGYYCITFRNNNANNSGVQGYITISTTSVAYTSVSDYRLKENVQPMTGALAKVSQLKPVTYTWKTDGSNGQGFIAHELQEVVPEAVTGEKDAVNKDDSIKAQGVDTSFLVATLTAAIQELNAKVVELEAKLNAK